MIDGLLNVLQIFFGWLFYLILQWTLSIVHMLENIFNVFAGTETVIYDGKSIYLLELFIGHSAITNIFWAMAIIGIILSFGFTIVAVARKVTDVTGTTKHTVGQILSQFFKSLLIIVMLNMIIVLSFNVTSVVFDRINYALENAESLSDGYERTYTDEEFATMTRILATMGNYCANPSAEGRYNVNACFNAIRGELATLHLAGCFDYDFKQTNGNDTWQSALAQVVKAADLTKDLQLDTYYAPVNDAIINIFDNLKYNPNFKPQKTAVRGDGTGKIDTATMIFLVSSMGAEENEQFRNGSLDDALRRSYISGEKSYRDFGDVFEDFAITEINYLVGIIIAGGIMYCFIKTIINFVVRMINLVILYVTSPLFASSMSLDEGSRFQGWVSSFVMQLLATFGCVIAMRLYLLMVPVITSSDMDLFPPDAVHGFAYSMDLDYFALLVFLLGGAWAVSKANTLIVGILTNNAASSVLEADSMAGGVAGTLTSAYSKMYTALPKWGLEKATDAVVRKFTGGAVGAKDLKKAAGKDKDGKGGDSLPSKLAKDTTSEQTNTSSIPAPPSVPPVPASAPVPQPVPGASNYKQKGVPPVPKSWAPLVPAAPVPKPVPGASNYKQKGVPPVPKSWVPPVPATAPIPQPVPGASNYQQKGVPPVPGKAAPQPVVGASNYVGVPPVPKKAAPQPVVGADNYVQKGVPPVPGKAAPQPVVGASNYVQKGVPPVPGKAAPQPVVGASNYVGVPPVPKAPAPQPVGQVNRNAARNKINHENNNEG